MTIPNPRLFTRSRPTSPRDCDGCLWCALLGDMYSILPRSSDDITPCSLSSSTSVSSCRRSPGCRSFSRRESSRRVVALRGALESCSSSLFFSWVMGASSCTLPMFFELMCRIQRSTTAFHPAPLQVAVLTCQQAILTVKSFSSASYDRPAGTAGFGAVRLKPSCRVLEIPSAVPTKSLNGKCY